MVATHGYEKLAIHVEYSKTSGKLQLESNKFSRLLKTTKICYHELFHTKILAISG